MRLPTRLLDRFANLRPLVIAAEWLTGLLATLMPGHGTIAAVEPADPVVEARRAEADGVVIAAAAGTPEELGQAVGARFRREITHLLQLMEVRTRSGHLLQPARWRALEAAVPERWRREIAATAAAANIDPGVMLAANVMVDTQCSALVAPALPAAGGGRPLMVARNMDFFPAAALGPGTVVMSLHPAGRHALVSVGWPGLAGVVSGMNDTGLTACVLLNYHGKARGTGQPVLFALRGLLEDCGSLAEALAALEAAPTSSAHYVLLADASGAALAWHDRDGFHVHRPEQGWLACSNGERTAEGVPSDDRGTRLRDLGRSIRPEQVDAAWMRRTLTATYLAGINAQAMLFIPATRTLELATGTGTRPAALQAWHRIPLAGLLADGDPAQTEVQRLPAAEPLPR